MRYISTSGQTTTDLRGATLHCIAPDGSLYLPESIPVIPRAFFNNIEEMNLREIAYVVVSSLIGDSIERAQVKEIVDRTFTFPLPMRRLGESTEVLELFEGPTLAFKDIGAKFLSSVLDVMRGHGHHAGHRVVNLVSTTGNTGAAIANAFASSKDADVVILFPRGALSRAEQAQFTTLGANIHAIEVGGNITQCKQLVKEALRDQTLAQSITPVCVNTHNILRIIPQAVFYFYAYSQLKKKYGRLADGFTAAVPCGCMSSLTAAVIAKRMGLPLGRIVAGCNANDDFVRWLNGEITAERLHTASRPTLAKAMDTGTPTNLQRLSALYKGDLHAIRSDIYASSADDDEIASTINDELERSGYLADPHTACALSALRALRDGGSSANNTPAVVLATAHPAKSLDVMTAITGRAVELPLQLTRFMTKGTPPAKIPPTYQALRRILAQL